MLDSVLLHLDFEKQQNTWQYPFIQIVPFGLYLRKGASHMMHPPFGTLSIHNRVGIVMMMELKAKVATRIGTPTTERIDPKACLSHNMMLQGRNLNKGVAKMNIIVILKDMLVKSSY